MLVNYIKINDEIISKFIQNEENSLKIEEEGQNNNNEKDIDLKNSSDHKSWNQDIN